MYLGVGCTICSQACASSVFEFTHTAGRGAGTEALESPAGLVIGSADHNSVAVRTMKKKKNVVIVYANLISHNASFNFLLQSI